MSNDTSSTSPELRGTDLTPYDRKHMKLCLRLLDSATYGGSWRETGSILFGPNAERKPERARMVAERTRLATNSRDRARQPVVLKAERPTENPNVAKILHPLRGDAVAVSSALGKCGPAKRPS